MPNFAKVVPHGTTKRCGLTDRTRLAGTRRKIVHSLLGNLRSRHQNQRHRRIRSTRGGIQKQNSTIYSVVKTWRNSDSRMAERRIDAVGRGPCKSPVPAADDGRSNADEPLRPRGDTKNDEIIQGSAAMFTIFKTSNFNFHSSHLNPTLSKLQDGGTIQNQSMQHTSFLAFPSQSLIPSFHKTEFTSHVRAFLTHITWSFPATAKLAWEEGSFQ